MASSQKVVTVDLGSSTLKVGEFGVGGDGSLTLLRFAVAELGLDPNKEEERAPFITAALARLFKENGVRGRDVILSVSGQNVFMKFVKLPPVAPEQIEQVVAFEAQQNVPFPIAEVTWDYQMMSPRGAGGEAEAVIVAIKKDVLEAEVAAVENAGVHIRQVDVAPFALLNAFRYSEPPSDECALIIDMGARSTNLVFVEKSWFWIRNVPIAGNQISQSICNEMQEPFVASEMLKKGKGFVSLGGVYADPDDVDAARISKLIRSTMTRLHVDINRSIAFYRTSLNGAAPKKVFLTGGSSQLPYLDLFIGDKLNLPVAYFNPLRNVHLGPAVDREKLQQDNCYTAELVGLALRLSGSAPAEVTLDAPTLAARADKKRKQPYFYAALAAWILLFVCLGLACWRQTGIVLAAADATQQKAGTFAQLRPGIDKLAARHDFLESNFNLVAQLGVERNAWPQILTDLNAHIPDGVWITRLVPMYDPSLDTGGTPGPGGRNGRGTRERNGAGGGGGFRGPGNFGGPGGGPIVRGPTVPTDEINVLVIDGLYHANDKTQVVDSAVLNDFVGSLAQLPYYDIDKNKITETLISFTTADTDPTSFAQKFTMHLKLKQPISLRP